MLYNRKNKILGILGGTFMLAATSCQDDALLNYDSSDSEEYATVTLSLSPESALVSRATGTDDLIIPDVISGGSHIDKLIYAVYVVDKDADGNDTYSLYTGYSTDPEESEEHGAGQIVKTIDHFPYPFHITLKRGVDYMLAFWAQSSETDAFDTRDLRKVEVKYNIVKEESNGENPESDDDENTTTYVSSVKNNDDLRDAFCRRVRLTVPKTGSVPQQNIYLYRPFAQINVGTSGFDYEAITRGATKKFTYSKIRLNRVARYLDICEDRTYITTTQDDPYGKKEDTQQTAESFAVVDFGYAPLPAYNHMDVPSYPSYTKYDWAYNPGFTLDNVDKKIYDDEEFLRVKRTDLQLDGKTEGVDYPWLDSDGYIGYATYTNYEGKDTETFKYLSMCYVLTASTETEADVLNNIKVWLATDENGSDETEIININQVKAQKNWRTNIIGNILTEQTSVQVSMDRNFAGEYNGQINGPNAQWTGQIADGVYYNGEEDVIEISNVNGLLWFQRMVNGDLIVRERYSSEEGQKYSYYDPDGNEKMLDYVSYSASNYSPEVRERIMVATHIRENTGLTRTDENGWPMANNFNFAGATIKLMADIDLAGIEWLPIGFDMAMHDGTVGGVDVKFGTLDYHDVLATHGRRRSFCGTFDGNNHTIRNLHNLRFGAKVHEKAEQTSGQYSYDNPQWFPAGFFGLVAGDAVIKNLRLQNVDIFGYNMAAAIAPDVNSKDGTVTITNCKVNGGSVILSPMYRGDTQKTENDYSKSRTFARGVYGGAIAGQWVANGSITDCEVSNVYIKGYRQIGGLVGSISNSEQSYWNDNLNVEIKGNDLFNVTVIADKFRAYYVIYLEEKNGYWRNGFGWSTGYASLSNTFVGGTETEQFAQGNNDSGTVLVELSTRSDDNKNYRESNIANLSLEEFPALSSWFCDNITLSANYYGKPSAYTRVKYRDFKPWSLQYTDGSFSVPFNLPYDLSVQYDRSSPRAGIYVESVDLDGKENAVGKRSVITPTDITGVGACVLYVTARDRKQFFDYWKSKNSGVTVSNDYRKQTKLSNMVLRGDPYAWSGIVFSPNENMSDVELNNVNIYDVYQTISIDQYTSSKADATGVDLAVNKSNLRGYTVPGAGWGSIVYNEVTFEQGTQTGYGRANDYKTLKIDKNSGNGTTTLTKCFFKAPYIIRIDEEADVVFDPYSSSSSANKCKATSAADGYVQIYLNQEVMNGKKCVRIEIDSDKQGNPLVYYTLNDGSKYDKDWKQM